MKTARRLINQFKYTLAFWSAIGAALISSAALADGDHGRKSDALLVKGYQAVTNMTFVDPAQPGILQVRVGGEGGLSHVGRMRGWSADETVDLATGLITAHFTFAADDGDRLVLATAVPSAFQPDGRITFEGSFTVEGGTGRVKKAKGTLHYEGWARTTDMAKGIGIGFFVNEGVLEGTKIDEAEPFAFTDKGTGTVIPPDFTFTGDVDANQLGIFQDTAHSTPGPFLSEFVGYIGGRFTIIESYDSTWTGKKDVRINFSAIELLSFAVNPDQSPDFTKPYIADTYMTVKSGKGRFKHAEGVALGKFNIVPTGPTTVASEQRGIGFLSKDDKD
jgi:hypothetical protein